MEKTELKSLCDQRSITTIVGHLIDEDKNIYYVKFENVNRDAFLLEASFN